MFTEFFFGKLVGVTLSLLAKGCARICGAAITAATPVASRVYRVYRAVKTTSCKKLYRATVNTVKDSYKTVYGLVTSLMIACSLYNLPLPPCVMLGMAVLNYLLWDTFLMVPGLRREKAQQAFREVTNGHDFLSLHNVADWLGLKELFEALDITFDSNESLSMTVNQLIWDGNNVICEADFVQWYVLVCSSASSFLGLANLQIATEDNAAMNPVEEDAVDGPPVDTPPTALVPLPLYPKSENEQATTPNQCCRVIIPVHYYFPMG